MDQNPKRRKKLNNNAMRIKS